MNNDSSDYSTDFADSTAIKAKADTTAAR